MKAINKNWLDNVNYIIDNGYCWNDKEIAKHQKRLRRLALKGYNLPTQKQNFIKEPAQNYDEIPF